MSAGDDVARMLTLVPWLLERPGASVQEAADAFGVTATTVRKDLSHLDFCGLPGLGGGALFDVTLEQERVVVSMADELRRPLRLTPREALRLVLSLQAVQGAFGEELPALTSAIEKVRATAGLPPDAAVAVGDGPTGPLTQARRALREGRRIRLTYQGRADDTPRDREVDPWQLDVTGEGWYLHGHDVTAGDHRVFRLDRVADLEVLDEPLQVPRPDHPLPEPRYEPDPDAITVVVDLAGSARWLVDAVAHDDVVDHGDRIEMTFRTDAPGWAVRLLMMGGPGVTVREPAGIATAVRQAAAEALARYQAPHG